MPLFLDDEGGGRVAEFIIFRIVSYLNSLTNDLSVMQDARILPLVLLSHKAVRRDRNPIITLIYTQYGL